MSTLGFITIYKKKYPKMGPSEYQTKESDGNTKSQRTEKSQIYVRQTKLSITQISAMNETDQYSVVLIYFKMIPNILPYAVQSQFLVSNVWSLSKIVDVYLYVLIRNIFE